MRVFLNIRMILLFIFLNQILMPSTLKMLLSWMALMVRNVPIGASTKADMNLPVNALRVPFPARRSPVMSTTQ